MVAPINTLTSCGLLVATLLSALIQPSGASDEFKFHAGMLEGLKVWRFRFSCKKCNATGQDPEYGEGIDCDACRGTGNDAAAEGNEPYRSYTLQEKPFHFTVIGNKSIVPDITNPEGYPIGILDETAKLACQYGRTKASYVMIPTKDLRFKNTKNEWMPFAEHCTECGQIFTPDQPDADQCSNQKCGNEGEGWKDLNELGETINELLYPARRRRLGAECPHGGILGTGKCCCACQSKGRKKCEGHKGLTMGLAGLNYCDSNCDDCKCSQTATTDTSQVYDGFETTADNYVEGVWKCNNGCRNRNTQTARLFPYTDGMTSYGTCNGQHGRCTQEMYWHSLKCWGKRGKCDDKCRCDCDTCARITVRTRKPRKQKTPSFIEGLWRCSARPRHTHGIEACKSSNVGDCRKCKSTMVFHSAACRGKGNCDNICGRRRLADTFPDCSVCEGSGKTRSWFLRQPCENCFGIGKVRD